MEVSDLIRTLVVALRGGNDSRCTLNKIGGGMYNWSEGLGGKQDILPLLGTETRFPVRSVSVLVNIPSRPFRFLWIKTKFLSQSQCPLSAVYEIFNINSHMIIFISLLGLKFHIKLQLIHNVKKTPTECLQCCNV
jgi:hypothetical protein